MGKSGRSLQAPPLTEEMHHELDGIEHRLRNKIHDRDSAAKILEYLRTYVLEFFQAFHKHYSGFSYFRRFAALVAQQNAILRTMAPIYEAYGTRNDFVADMEGELSQTIKEDYERKKEAEATHDATTSGAGKTPDAAARQNSMVPSIGEEIKRLLTEARKRPEDIAEVMGIDPRTVYRNLNGSSLPTLVNIGKYEQALSSLLKRDIKLPMPVKSQRASKLPAKRQ